MIDIIERARVFAFAAHAAAENVRKYTFESYYVHPYRVADLVESLPFHTPQMVAAAYLHDVVEDTGVTLDQIKEMFGDTVCEYVGLLTNVPRESGFNRATRKQMDRRRLARAPAEVQTIKLADMLDNNHDIAQHDANFGIVYARECQELLGCLNKGDESLRNRLKEELRAIVEAYKNVQD